MHAVQHLADCVLDYGPAHGWTCFAFERMNGTLKETSTNMRNVEETLVRVWMQRDYLQILPHLNGRWGKMTQSARPRVEDAGLPAGSSALRFVGGAEGGA